MEDISSILCYNKSKGDIMEKIICFLGHRILNKKEEIKRRIMNTLKEKVPNGYTTFLVGKHGEFDNLALNCCIDYKKTIDKKVNINIVLTSIAKLKKDEFGYNSLDYYREQGCKIMIYDIEDEYFKRRIIVSNRKMIEDSDLVISYADMSKIRSGAKIAIKYALKQGKEIINLYNETDKAFYGMTKEEIDYEREKFKKEHI